MGHVSVLQSGSRLLVKVGRVGPEHEQSDGEMIQLHAHVGSSV